PPIPGELPADRCTHFLPRRFSPNPARYPEQEVMRRHRKQDHRSQIRQLRCHVGSLGKVLCYRIPHTVKPLLGLFDVLRIDRVNVITCGVMEENCVFSHRIKYLNWAPGDSDRVPNYRIEAEERLRLVD